MRGTKVLFAVFAMLVIGCCSRTEYQSFPTRLQIDQYLQKMPDRETETKELLTRAKAACRPDQLLTWAKNVLNAKRDGAESYALSLSELPAFVKKIDRSAPMVFVIPGSHVDINWGGGFGHWGIAIGPNYTPQNPELYTLEWVPGIYVYTSKH